MRRLMIPLLLAGCASTGEKPTEMKADAPPREVLAGQRVTAALAKLPACGDGVEAAGVDFDGMCTLKACVGVVKDGALLPAPKCCNSCGVSPVAVKADGTRTALDLARVKQVLDLGDSSMDCELDAWRAALGERRVSFDEPACVAPPAPKSPDVVATERVKAALAKLPTCQPGADVGRLMVRSTMCTRKFCQTACCNQCGWGASFEGMNGQPHPVELARVREVLDLGEGALDCEVKAWAVSLDGVSLQLDAPACVVR